VTARQMTAARLMVLEGMSAYRALCQAGYARSTARMFGMLLRGSWGLREALKIAQDESGRSLAARPVRRRKYDRRSLALNVREYVAPYLQAATTNTFLHKLHADEKRAHAIAEGKHALPSRCSVCRGLTEGNDHWCPRCQQTEKR
jgi:rubrerythrin